MRQRQRAWLQRCRRHRRCWTAWRSLGIAGKRSLPGRAARLVLCGGLCCCTLQNWLYGWDRLASTGTRPLPLMRSGLRSLSGRLRCSHPLELALLALLARPAAASLWLAGSWMWASHSFGFCRR